MKSQGEILEIWSAMEECIRAYASRKRAQTGAFCEKYYGWEGTLRIHADAIKEDLATNPLNTLWAIPFVILKSTGDWAHKLGWNAPNRVLGAVPNQLKTGSQKKLEWLLLTELLELPYHSGVLKSRRDVLAEEYSRHPRLAPLRDDPEWSVLLHSSPGLWKQELAAQSAESSAAADLASTATTLLAGWYLFGQASLGVFDMGSKYAHRMAHQDAVSRFPLGHKLGGVFYRFFPANPSHSQIILSTVAIMAAVAALSVVIHALIDPIHQAMGLHRVRLGHFIDALEEKLLSNVRSKMAAKLLRNGEAKAAAELTTEKCAEAGQERAPLSAPPRSHGI